MTDMQIAELRVLLDALCEESISVEEMRRLEELVLGDPQAEAYYVQYLALFADLSRAKLPIQLAPAPSAPTPRPWRKRGWLIGGGIALAAMAACIAVMLTVSPRHNVGLPVAKNPAPREQVDDSIAILSQAHEAQWDKADLPTRVGSPLRQGTLRLKSGVAQLEFYSGATVILQGPAELRLVSRTEAFCVHGKLRATVPPQAHGFTIGSPKLNLVDLGTEFGMAVDAQGKMEVHVFAGKVELHDKADPNQAAVPTELTTGQSVRFEDAKNLKPIESNAAGFVTAKTLAAEAQKELDRRQKTWQAASEAIRKDPALVAYFPFQSEKPWQRTLRDAAGQRDGTIVGCAWSSGRWAGKQGLEFKKVSDRVRVNVPGDFQSITMMAWVRVDALPNVNNSLLMADAWAPGGLHWQIGSDGKLILGVQSQPRGRGAHYHAPGAITPEDFGAWRHLAVVYDHQQKLVTHLVNGEKVAEVPLEFDIPLRIGNAEIGNWNIASHRNNSPIRFLTGCIDEFMIFARALSADEIERFHSQSRPPS